MTLTDYLNDLDRRRAEATVSLKADIDSYKFSSKFIARERAYEELRAAAFDLLPELVAVARATTGMRCFNCRRYLSESGIEVGPCRECEPLRKALARLAAKAEKVQP